VTYLILKRLQISSYGLSVLIFELNCSMMKLMVEKRKWKSFNARSTIHLQIKCARRERTEDE
jgi:hypothetical protein